MHLTQIFKFFHFTSRLWINCGGSLARFSHLRQKRNVCQPEIVKSKSLNPIKEGLTALTQLNLNGNQLRNSHIEGSALKEAKGLKTFEARNNRLSRIPTLSNTTETLDLSGSFSLTWFVREWYPELNMNARNILLSLRRFYQLKSNFLTENP